MIWSILSWILLVFAFIVGVRALLWDRAGFRGRASLRCRKCWYDLSAAPGDLRDGPIVCPECGKTHASRQAMRKTRRGKRWIVAAIGLLVLAHGARVTPSVRERGVWASAPSWFLILGIHRTPRSVDQTMQGWSSIAFGGDTPLQRAMQELQIRARMNNLGWFDFQLTAWLARLESEELLCRNSSNYGGVSPRALGYCWILSRGIHRGMLGEFHKDWFSSLSVATVEVRGKWPERASVYGRVGVFFAKNDNSEWNDRPWFNKLRVRSKWVSFYRNHPVSVGWDVDPFPVGGNRNLYIRNDPGEWYPAHRLKIWDDGLVPFKVKSSSSMGEAHIEVYRTSGQSGPVFDNEQLINEHLVEFKASREGNIEEYVVVLDDEVVRKEIERCLEVDAKYWYDMDGRWHSAFKLRLIDNPNLGRRRYTFGASQIRSISRQEELTGQAWWALNPVGVQGWELVHENEYVLMHGWADETIDPGPYGHIDNLKIKADPAFGLRDEHASLVIGGRIRLKVNWKQVQVHVN